MQGTHLLPGDILLLGDRLEALQLCLVVVVLLLGDALLGILCTLLRLDRVWGLAHAHLLLRDAHGGRGALLLRDGGSGRRDTLQRGLSHELGRRG